MSFNFYFRVPSVYFLLYFINNVIKYVGFHPRAISKKPWVERTNPSFQRFVLSNNIYFPANYRQVTGGTDAEYRSVSAYDSFISPIFDELSVNVAEQWMFRQYSPFLYGSAVVSFDTVKTVLNKQTSAGFPANKKAGTKSKAIILFYHILDVLWYLYSTLNPPFPVWTLSIKRELRTIKKIQKFGGEFDNFRTFTASPFELTMINNRLCLDFNDRFYRAAGKTHSECGSTKFYGGFAVLLAKFFRNDKPMLCWSTDLKRYDSTQCARLLHFMRRFRETMWSSKYKTSANQLRLFWVYFFIINAVIITTEGELIMKQQGTTSGNGNTIVDNGCIADFALMYSWLVLYQRRFPDKYPDYEYFQQCVAVSITGDNLFFGVINEDIASWFNARAVAEVFLSIGLTMTADNWDYDMPWNLEFCSMTFGEIDGRVVPVCDYDKMICSMMYGSKVNDVRWDLMRAFALRIETWTNIKLRTIISDYISFILEQYSSDLIGEVKMGEQFVTMSQIFSMFKSDDELRGLYCGLESGSAVKVDEASLHLIIYDC